MGANGYLSKFGLDDPWSNAVNPDVVTGHLHDDDDFDDDDDDDDYDDDDDDDGDDKMKR